jgi:hypothetical protein
MNAQAVRKTFTKANKSLREARRDYINEKRHAILASKGNDVINQVAYEMIELGLYAKPVSSVNWRDLRFWIVRAIYRIECEIWGKHKTGLWHFWTVRNGFDTNFGRNLKQIA